MKFIQEVKAVRAWAEVTIRSGMMEEARRTLTTHIPDTAKALRQYRQSKSGNGTLYVPRALAFDSGLPVTNERRTWGKISGKSKITQYRLGQKEAIAEYMKGLKEHPYGGILQAVTGSGKTIMAIDIAYRLGLKTLVIVPRTALLTQWVKRITEFTTVKRKDIGIVQGDTCEWDKPFVVAMIHSLAQKWDDYSSELFYTFGTVIFDEVHVVGAETFSRTAPMFLCKYRIGLSATPRRKDGMDRVFWWHIGPLLSRYKKLQAEARVRLVPYRGLDANHTGCVWGGKLNLGRYFNRITQSTTRTDMLATFVAKLYERDNDILFLSDRIAHLERMKALLVNMEVKGKDIGFLTGSIKQLDKKVILGTYGSAGMGVDIPRLTALVLGTPRADIEQAVGRVLRQGTPIVIDIVDMASGIMQGWAMARLKFYKKITKNLKDRSGLLWVN